MAAQNVLRCADDLRDAINGFGHRHEDHDRALAHPIHLGDEVVIIDQVGDCAACAGSQMQAEAGLYQAYGDLRVALGAERKPWE